MEQITGSEIAFIAGAATAILILLVVGAWQATESIADRLGALDEDDE